jgi:hypothetical protein
MHKIHRRPLSTIGQHPGVESVGDPGELRPEDHYEACYASQRLLTARKAMHTARVPDHRKALRLA